MIFDWHDPMISFEQAPYTIKDDMGREIDSPIVWLDTVTGEVRSFMMSKDGGYYENPEGHLVKSVTLFMPPLRVYDKDNRDISDEGIKRADKPIEVVVSKGHFAGCA